jgi:hypothetical protein
MGKKTQHVYRTLEERKGEIRKIIDQLNKLQLSIDYGPINKLYDVMFNYIRCGERTMVNIPFPEKNKRIQGVLAINIREEVALRLKHENY